MNGHVPQYLDAQALRLRAERAERLARTWRIAGWVFGLVIAWLLCALVVQERKLYDSLQYSIHAERSERAAQKETTVCEAALDEQRDYNYELLWTNESLKSDMAVAIRLRELDGELSLYSEQLVHETKARDAAEHKFKVCLSANAGLVDVLKEFDRTVKDQQLVIDDAVALAKRCEASPVTWAQAQPGGWQVVDHAR